VALTLAALSLAASASPAGASVTIGQVAPAPPPATCMNSVDAAQATVISGNPYVVPGTGTITSWSHKAANSTGGELTMKIFRKVADPSTYAVVGHDGPRTLARGELNTFPASIAVSPGDVLGLNYASPVATGCGFEAVGESVLVKDGSLADGESGAFSSTSESSRLNVSAVFVYSNAFTLGKAKRNQKRGTATITAEVPNPGVLALSGKGVKPAGAGGAQGAKTVPAAGMATLLIKARGKSKRKLDEAGKVKVKSTITYTPTGGDPSTQSRKLTLKKS
jgi:hypothetical protein